ncbi:MAG TPA: ABC transporter permease subunit [Sandaracinaceae bacterium LLY-WYZ-13_1]|nr:ABC transporter permease subunit [Sandaracinaceae bacterium LLY-WYZ-13_1]
MAVWTILKREVYAFFVSPMAYIMLTAWLLLCGLNFTWLATYYASQPIGAGAQSSPLPAFFGGTTLFYLPILVFVPLMTMRLLAQERSRGTIELLMTAPVGDVSIVIGKYLASLVFWMALWVPTLLYVWLTSHYGDVDAGVVAASYLGIFLIGTYYLAIGLLMSAIAPQQMIAALLTFLALGTLFVLGVGQYIFDEYRDLFTYVSIWGHMESFSRGVVDSRYLVFDLSVAALALTLTVGVLHARRTEG